MRKSSTSTEAAQSESRYTRRGVLKASLVLGVAGTGAAAQRGSAASTSDVEAHRLAATQHWRTQAFDSSYTNPVVVALPVSTSGYQPATSRVQEVDGRSFEYRVQEWNYLDGPHVEEVVGSLVVEAGTSAVEGLQLESGTVKATTGWTGVSFDEAFDKQPVVLTQPQSTDGWQAVVSRNRSISKRRFATRLQEEEANDNWHHDETVGYVAVEPGTGSLGGAPFEAGREASVGHEWQTLEFDESYDNPVFVADVETFNGNNPCSLRYRNLTRTSVEVRVEEERSADDEQWHKPETVGYVVVEGDDIETFYGEGRYGADGFGA
ncbi:hypothetical protein AUR64_07460 [Haloprofundus marisrubri]|uniref:Uncharacterized protein n=1 Tax=Haloprofundus marisrubri TaxID=1514971 RepID=A0A0W1RBU5_9EURY|nr:hypothetical protein [Haloprofundus marisrubri]KTG10995.1 hypothetical protein AUR64_07460 [Haloprofundus marisrubri]